MFSSVFSWWFFCYLIIVWLSEAVRFLGYRAGAGLGPGVWPMVLAVLLSLPVIGPRTRQKKWCMGSASWQDAAIIGYLSVFALCKMVFPDVSEDTLKYHIFLQEPLWKDMISYHLLPGGFQGFGFPLGDRLFYPFRQILGYRMGTVFNLLCLLLLYIQARRILYKLCGFRLQRFQPVLCLVAVAQHDVLMQMGSYMVEMVGTILFMESIWFLLQEPENRQDMVIFASLQGFLFAVKMTNIIYVIPLLALYIYKNRKSITLPLFAACFLAGAMPVSIYLANNWLCTGNPVFPYYNSLFHSPYFGNHNFKDTRWGGTSRIEMVLWPWIGIIWPQYRQSELPAPYTWGYGAAWILSCFYCVKNFFTRRFQEKKRDILLEILTILVLASSLLWSLTTGHIRYYMGGYILLVLLGISSAARLTGEKKPLDMALVLGLAVMVPGPLLAAKSCMEGREWNFRPAIASRVLPGGIPMDFDNLEMYKEQMEWIGKDKKLGTKEQREKPEKLLLFGFDGGLASLLNPSLPVISWDLVTTTVNDQVFQSVTGQMEEELEHNNRVYGIAKTEKGEMLNLEEIYEYRFGVDAIELAQQQIFPGHDVYLLRLKGPADPKNHLNRQRAVGILGTDEAPLGHVSSKEPFTLWVETPGLKTAPALQEDSLHFVTLKILEGEERRLLKKTTLDLREQHVYEIPLVPETGQEPVKLYGLLELAEEDHRLTDYAKVWVRTSLKGNQELAGRLYYVQESGLIRQGWSEDDNGRYYADFWGKLYTGWKKVDGTWYYFSEDGSMYKGWLYDDFYLREDGSMAIGTEIIDGIPYRFDSEGHLCPE